MGVENLSKDLARAVEAAQRGKRRAAEELCVRVLPLVRWWVRRLVPADAVDDVVQASLLAGVAGLRRCEPVAWLAYLRGATWRQAAVWHRARARRERLGAALELVSSAELTHRCAAELAVELAELRCAVARLPEPYRVAVELALDGATGRESAERMGVSEHTVRSRISRGRKILRLTADRGRAGATKKPTRR